MTRGRKLDLTRLLERLDGSAEARARLQVFLEVLAGHRTAAQAALALGLSERRGHDLRCRLLQGALNKPECFSHREHRGHRACKNTMT
jgi:hypothetical protein